MHQPAKQVPNSQLVPIGPRIHHLTYDRAAREALRRFQRAVHEEVEAANLHTFLLASLSRYNRLVRRLPRERRVAHSLFSLSLLYMDSPHIAGQFPPPPTPNSYPVRPSTSKADLRIEARRNRVPAPLLWERFPPDTLFERKEMYRELGAYHARQAPKVAKATGDGFSDFLKRQAREAGQLAKDPTLAGRLLSSPEWKARQRASYNEILKIAEDLDI